MKQTSFNETNNSVTGHRFANCKDRRSLYQFSGEDERLFVEEV